VTDPFANGWYDSANPGNEIGDMCRFTYPAGSVTLLWSNNGSLGSCTNSFTPRYTYKVLSALAPLGEPGGVYARGHAYDGGQVLVSNTGNMPWFPLGRNATYLGTWSTASRCSHIADMNTRDASNPWKGCTRIRMTGAAPVEPRAIAPDSSAATFDMRVKADGAYVDGGVGTEDFNLVSSVWMSPSGGGTPAITVPAARYNAKHSAPTTGEPIVAGVAGTDMPVQLDFTNTGTAPWYQNEVVYLGATTAAGTGHSSAWAASTWPKTGACSNCRAARVASTTAPSSTYTFKFSIHVPATMATGVYTEYFRPVADVAINSGGIASKYFGPAVPVTIVVVGVPVGSHQLMGDGTIGSEPTQGYDTTDLTAPTPNGHWYMCTAVATADAVSISIDTCTVNVTRADGTGYGYESFGGSTSGGVATVVGDGVFYDETAGDTATVCWTAHAGYLDGSTLATSGCSV